MPVFEFTGKVRDNDVKKKRHFLPSRFKRIKTSVQKIMS